MTASLFRRGWSLQFPKVHEGPTGSGNLRNLIKISSIRRSHYIMCHSSEKMHTDRVAVSASNGSAPDTREHVVKVSQESSSTTSRKRSVPALPSMHSVALLAPPKRSRATLAGVRPETNIDCALLRTSRRRAS